MGGSGCARVSRPELIVSVVYIWQQNDRYFYRQWQMINNVRIFFSNDAIFNTATLDYQRIFRTNSLALIRKIVYIFMPLAKKHDAFVHREALNCASHQIERSFPGAEQLKIYSDCTSLISI